MGVRHWWTQRSLRFRLTAVASAALALALAGAAYVFVGVLGRSLIAQIDDEVYQRAREVVALSDADRLDGRVILPDSTVVQVVGANGRIEAATPGTDRLVPLLSGERLADALARGEPRHLDGRGYGLPGALRVRALRADGGKTVIAARSIAEIEGSLRTTGHVLLVGTPLLLVLLALATWGVVGGTLRPIAALRRGAAAISGSDRRLPVPASRDEVHALATTLNDMLARLEAADARQRALISDAAHELRSPLASIRLQLEVALNHPEGQDWPETAEGVLEDTLRLTRLAEGLLALARLDEGRPIRREPVDLAELVAEHGATGTPPGAVVLGDALDLRRVLTNLVDNAARHATSKVEVALRVDGDAAEVTVTDDGPGIPPADRERVFDRFTRLDDARSRDDGGAGLGLAIVRETVRAHGGTVHLTDAPDGGKGLRAIVRLPIIQSND
ncbi:HAMP domain-containing histidine kinase [Streptosporangiaceae bacterium NEAU-GS5]|nr:HAMP domain-containing histidine kinase [Streptosporangiaceae bacterium NEAU-GS5]